VSIVARRHDLNANLLFTWQRRLQREESGAGLDPASFVPAIVAPDAVARPGSSAMAVREHQRDSKDDDTARQRPGVIEIVLLGGRRVIVEEKVSAAALARVLGVLERR
jgi:transposase